MKVYVISYASYLSSEYEVYAQTLAVFADHDQAKEFMQSQFNSIRNDDFEDYTDDQLHIYRTDNSFSINNEETYIEVKLETKLLSTTPT